MYNIRKKLTALTVILFAAAFVFGIVESRLAKRGTGDTVSEDTSVSAAETESATSNPLFTDNTARFVAHRGYSAAAPENTALAFELAGKSRFWGIETDIAETYDGEFVCMHDDEIDRTTDGTGPVSWYTYESLQELTIDAGSNIDLYQGLKIPTMTEFLDICVTYGCVPVIEIKSVTDYDKFLQTIYDSGIGNLCIITGGIEDLREIRARDADITLMVIGYSNKEYEYYVDLILELDGENNGVLYNYPVVTEDVVNSLHSRNLACAVWSLDTEEEARQYAEYGADFIVTNEIPASLDLMINTTE